MPDSTNDPLETQSASGPSVPEGAPVLPGTVLGYRYVIEERLGAGGFGTVYLAFDRRSSERVAVKIAHAAHAGSPRAKREMEILNSLHVPGTARLRDRGEEFGRTYFVMDYVDGRPFPGRGPLTWSELAPIAVALCECLARVHAVGVIHRDLKPDNVLVDGEGRPVLLDFGLSWLPDWDAQLTRDGGLGTPGYSAPEQLGSRVVDQRADLFSVGVMLYEALTGDRPYPETGSGPPPITERVELPVEIGELIGKMIQRDPDRRPRSAAEVVAVLGGESLDPESRLPWMVSDEVKRSIDRALTGESLDVSGETGFGRTRYLQELAERVRAEGREPIWIWPSARPFGSLNPLCPPPSGASANEYQAILESSVRERIESGAVFLVDDADRVDARSSRVLAACRRHGSIVRIVDGPGDVSLGGGIEQEELERLFHGPDRLFHLREDAAAQLHLRTHGVPAMVYQELEAWRRAGLAVRDGDRYRITRDAVDGLSTGYSDAHLLLRPGRPCPNLEPEERDLVGRVHLAFPHATVPILASASGRDPWAVESGLERLAELGIVRSFEGSYLALVSADPVFVWTPAERAAVHRRLAEAVPSDSPAAFFHALLSLRAVSDPEGEEARSLDLWRVAEREVDRLRSQEQVKRACMVAGLSLRTMNLSSPDMGDGLLLQWVRCALDEGLGFEIRSVLDYLDELGESGAVRPVVQEIRLLLQAHRAAMTGHALRDLPVGFDRAVETRALDRWRVALRMKAIRNEGDLEAEEEALADLERELGSEPDEWANLHLLMGQLRYRQGRFEEAAHCHLCAARQGPESIAQIGALTNAAAAYLEAHDFESCRRVAEEARERASLVRLTTQEARAESLLRVCAYRLELEDEPDRELVEAGRSMGQHPVVGSILMGEAVFAWRQGDLESGRTWGAEACDILGRAGWTRASRLASAVAALCGCATSTERLLDPAEVAKEDGFPATRLQLAAIRRRLGVETPISAELIMAAARQVGEKHWSRRREILALAECAPFRGEDEGCSKG